MQGVISVFMDLLRLASCPIMWSVLGKVHKVLESIFFFCLSETFYKYLLGLFDLWCYFAVVLLCLVFVWMTFLVVRVGY